MGKISILGTDYELIIDRSDDNPKLHDADAYVEKWSKKIVLAPYERDKMTVECLESYAAKIIRHEIVHAFFHECGLANYCADERLVDWIAHHLPNLERVCKVAEAAAIQAILPKPPTNPHAESEVRE